MRIISVLIIFLAIPILSEGQLDSRKEIKIPDIPGYLTLKCDFHMHTIFSDGLVWPTVRVEEAWREGLDVIAFSDHIEYTPFKDDVRIKFGRAYEIAGSTAEKYDIIIIQAAEITRSMPPGHFNCLFLKNVTALDTPDFWDAIDRAAEQDAFIIWNHPGWRMEDEIPIWYNDHTRLYNEGHMNGIEIANGRSFYPLAFQWSVEKNIGMFGSSDIHSPIGMSYDLSLGDQRTMTLVFAISRTEEAVKEALLNGRTVVYTGEMLIGKPEFLKAIFQNSVKVTVKDSDFKRAGTFYVQVTNTCDVPFRLVSMEQPKGLEYPLEITLWPERTVILSIKAGGQSINNHDGIRLPFTVKNLLVNIDAGLPVELIIKDSEKK